VPALHLHSGGDQMNVPDHLDHPPNLLLICSVAERLFAISAATVERIVRMVAITPLTNAPPNVLGLIDLHGVILRVVDPRARLGLPATEPDIDQHLVIVSGRQRYALWIDRAEDVSSVQPADFETAPVPGASAPLFVRRAGALIPVLSMDDTL
jgi:purine-binding chemotaxis protein CheW